jgi:leucyl aminopeptidase
MAEKPVIAFSKLAVPGEGTLVLLAAAPNGGDSNAGGTDDVRFGAFAASVDASTGGALARAAKAARFTAKPRSVLELWAPAGLAVSRLLLVGLGHAGELGQDDWRKLGGAIMGRLSSSNEGQAFVGLELPGAEDEAVAPANAAELAFGARLRAYRFDKYKSKGEDEKNANGEQAPKKALEKLTIGVGNASAAKRDFADREAVAGGVLLARELVNEPANELGPKEFAEKAKALSKLGVEVDILTEKDMAKLKMAALLGVAQGSERPPRLVVMRWNGASDKKAPPLAFIGKGVVFDSGGISIKPSGGMEDMKGDMGGAAAVTGLMHALAARKAKVNAVGVIGLVENMPDGKAQRPGDIVRSMSGQTIEIINTDAEGRLVLADALWYTKEKYKPALMIDLATLTGAVIIALGKHHAGLFTNNDELAERLTAAGKASGEAVWRLPLSKDYDKLIDSKNADMKNTGGRYAGSITAAQFLQRYVDGCAWAHLDIAGTAMDSPGDEVSKGWASGFGVRLLDRLVADNYEK